MKYILITKVEEHHSTEGQQTPPIRVDSTSCGLIEIAHHLTGGSEKDAASLLAKKCRTCLNLILRAHQTNPNWESFFKITALYPKTSGP